MNAYDRKPWLALYDRGQPADIAPQYGDALSIFADAVARAPDKAALCYFDAILTYRDLDALSDALAAVLCARGFTKGDRLALYLQNVPQFAIAMLAAWKAGGVAVPINPMNRERELRLLFADCEPRALVCHDDLYEQVVSRLSDISLPPIVFTTSSLDFQTRRDPRLFENIARVHCHADDLLEAISAHSGQKPPEIGNPTAKDLAYLVYTSGTTGLPKGAMITHGGTAFNAQAYRDWMELKDGEPILGVAPLFHITGLIGHVVTAFLTASPLVLSYRFEPGVMLDAIEEHRPVFTVGAITVFIALMHHGDARRERLHSLTKIYSGGAPIPPSVVEEFQAKFGHYIRNAYGLTETTSPTHFVPLGRIAPVDPVHGALSIGVPIYNVRAWIAGDDGQPVAPGESGELVLDGPMIAPGYWRKPAETAAAMRPDGFRTGDIGIMDEKGWFYLVDRKKDMIVSSGYKVWPREVEDVLYSHPAVREAAVIGVKDDYRGETVKAFISLKPGTSAREEELIAYCKERMAAYKYPRLVEVMGDLPKTPSGKILRRSLR